MYTAKHGSFAEHVLIFIFNREMCDFYSTLETLKTQNLLHPCGVTCGLELWKSDLNSRTLSFSRFGVLFGWLIWFWFLFVDVIVVFTGMFLLRE